MWIPLAVSETQIKPGQAWPTHLLGLLGPALAAIVVTFATQGKAGLCELATRAFRFKVRWQWYGLVALTAVFIAFGLANSSSPVDFLRYSGAGDWGFLVIPYVFILNGLGEEIGWRGFLVEELAKKFSIGVTSLLTWVLWGVWHIPLFWFLASFIDLGVGGTIGWTVGLLAGSIFLTWMYTKSDHSILIVALWHTIFNFSTATIATAGLAAAISSTIVMVAAVAILAFPSTWRRKMA
jgi:membrane protease YdiL (CAAX protease family)